MTRAIYLVSLRQLTSRSRLAILFLLCTVPFLLAGVAGSSSAAPSATDLDNALLNGLLVAAILPITVLAVATAAFGNEVSDKTLSNLTLTPVAHSRIVAAKLAATTTVCAPPLTVSAGCSVLFGYSLAGVAGAGRAATAAAAAVAVGVVLYAAVFLWAGLMTSHPLVLGLLYVFVWEGLFGGLVQGIRYVSIRQYALGVAKAVDASRFAGPDEHLLGPLAAIVAAIVVFCCFTALAVRRLRRMDVP